MTADTSAFVERLFIRAVKKQASDIHFHPSPTYQNVAIFFRILGERTFIQRIPLTFYQRMLTYVKFRSNLDIGENKRPQNGTITFTSENNSFHLRISTLPIQRLESLTIRLFPQRVPPALEDLVLFSFQASKIRKWIYQPNGLLLISGPTGSGKSTLMYSLLQELIDQRNCQIVTLEDPVERQIENALQVEINERAGMTYEEGLRAALRHDPDVLLVGEIRDEKTAKFTIRSALTGHLVLSTIHAKDLSGTVERLVDLGISRTDLSQTVVGIASLRLLPIISYGKIHRRALIMEMLDGELLQSLIQQEPFTRRHTDTFANLKEKAWCYGFIDKKLLTHYS